MLKRTLPLLFIITALSLPAFFRMLRPGIFTMHDFHVFRLHEYHLCILDGIFPCRWAPNSTWQYGQPLFNFYGQLPYLLGEPFQLLGIQTIDTVKILFIFSLVGSGYTMFLLAQQLWKNSLAALTSSLIYIYAPYRAVDVWVRGALPEALSFVLFPLIIYFFNRSVFESSPPKTSKFTTDTKSVFSLLPSTFRKVIPRNTPLYPLAGFSIALALLILTHNLSAIMFLFFAIPWGLYLLIREKKLPLILPLGLGGIFSLLLSAFYLLPVALETHLITLNQTTVGYYNYQAHFTTLTQLLISRFWGYGASLWGPVDDLSLSVGQLQWLLPTLLSIFIISKYLLIPIIRKPSPKQKLLHLPKRISSTLLNFYTVQSKSADFRILDSLILFSLGWFALFLTHGRSLLLWKLIPPLTFVQFPWRFLSIATFSFSLTAGSAITIIRTKRGSNPPPHFPFKSLRLTTFSTIALTLLVILLNQQLFRPDIWRSITDRQQFSGSLWEEQVASAISDFWPKTAPLIPHSFAPRDPLVPPLTAGTGKQLTKNSHSAQYQLNLVNPATVQFPIVYFPGWQINVSQYRHSQPSRARPDESKNLPQNQELAPETTSQRVPAFPSGDYGLITTQLPAGSYHINLRFTNTPARTIGNFISLISLITLIAFLLLPKNYKTSLRHNS
jgi:hypothetical protein